MKISLLLFCLFLGSSLVAQTKISTNFNSTASGRNVSLLISKTKNNHEFGGGIRYNIGKLAMPDDQGNVFLKRLYPSTFAQHWGAEAFYHYRFFNSWKHLKPFVFYDVQASYSTSRNSFYTPHSRDEIGRILYLYHVKRFGPYTWLEQYIGFGFKVELPNQFFISQKIGAGGCLIFGEEEQLVKYSTEWEFGGLINVGIGYRFEYKMPAPFGPAFSWRIFFLLLPFGEAGRGFMESKLCQ